MVILDDQPEAAQAHQRERRTPVGGVGVAEYAQHPGPQHQDREVGCGADEQGGAQREPELHEERAGISRAGGEQRGRQRDRHVEEEPGHRPRRVEVGGLLGAEDDVGQDRHGEEGREQGHVQHVVLSGGEMHSTQGRQPGHHLTDRYPVLAHEHDDDHRDRDDIGHEPTGEDDGRAVARQRQREDDQQDQLDDRLNGISDELHAAADETEQRHIEHVPDALGRHGRREEHRHADFPADTGQPEETTGQRQRTHQCHDGPDHPGDQGGGGDQLGAAPAHGGAVGSPAPCRARAR